MKEDDFNKNAALVPETDPNVTLINDRIQQLKDSVEKISNERISLMNEFKIVNELRSAQFLELFDSVAQ